MELFYNAQLWLVCGDTVTSMLLKDMPRDSRLSPGTRIFTNRTEADALADLAKQRKLLTKAIDDADLSPEAIAKLRTINLMLMVLNLERLTAVGEMVARYVKSAHTPPAPNWTARPETVPLGPNPDLDARLRAEQDAAMHEIAVAAQHHDSFSQRRDPAPMPLPPRPFSQPETPPPT